MMDKPLSAAEVAIADGERAMYPMHSYCSRCKRPWALVTPHQVNYSVSGGCFALCEGCHDMLTYAERLIYFKQTWIRYWTSHPWEVYRAAVLHERQPEQVASLEAGREKVKERPDYYRSGIVNSNGVWWIHPRLAPEIVQAWKDNGVEMLDDFPE